MAEPLPEYLGDNRKQTKYWQKLTRLNIITYSSRNLFTVRVTLRRSC